IGRGRCGWGRRGGRWNRGYRLNISIGGRGAIRGGGAGLHRRSTGWAAEVNRLVTGYHRGRQHVIAAKRAAPDRIRCLAITGGDQVRASSDQAAEEGIGEFERNIDEIAE